MLPLTLVTLALESGELMSEVSLGGASVPRAVSAEREIGIQKLETCRLKPKI